MLEAKWSRALSLVFEVALSKHLVFQIEFKRRKPTMTRFVGSGWGPWGGLN